MANSLQKTNATPDIEKNYNNASLKRRREGGGAAAPFISP